MSIPTDTPEQLSRAAHFKQMIPAKVAPLAVYLASDRSAEVNAQVFTVRNNEIFLMSQPRPLRSVHRSDGWTAQSIEERLIESQTEVAIYCRPDREGDPRLNYLPLFREQMMIVLPLEHRLASRATIEIKDLAGETVGWS